MLPHPLMNWLNVRTELSRDPHFVTASCAALGAWFRVHLYCCEQENGGVVAGAASWTDRQWIASCGVTKREVTAAAPLLANDGVSIAVLSYSLEKEAEVKAKRSAGSKAGRGRSRSLPPGTADSSADSSAIRSAMRSALTEGKGREEEGNGKELREQSSAALQQAADWGPEAVWRRLCAIFGRPCRGMVNGLIGETLSALDPLPTPAELDLLAAFVPAALANEDSIEKWHPRETADSLALNLHGELDKARRWAKETGRSGPRKAALEPSGWREKFKALWPEAQLPETWEGVPGFARKELSKTTTTP